MIQIYLVAFEVFWIACDSLAKPLTINEIVPPDYDKLLPPKIVKGAESLPVNVTLSLYIIQIRSFDEVEMDFKMDILLRKQWRDGRLIFPQNIAGGRSKIVLDPTWRNEIWTPDVWFKNALDTRLQQWVMPSIFYWLENNKTVHFSGRVTLDLSCDMDMENYPHDSQFCGVSIMSLMNPSVDLVLNWDPQEAVRISKILTLPQFEFGDASLGNCDTHMYGETFSCINASFVLNRRSGYFIINIYIPTVLIVSMSMLTFWIPPEAVPARITLGVTSLLTIITKQYQSNMPSVSYVVALNIWLSCCIAFVFCSLLEYALVITLVKKKQMEVKPVIHHQTNNEGGCGGSKGKSQIGAWIGHHCQIFQNYPHLIDMGSKFLFPVTFIIFCIAYGVRYSI